MTNRGNRIFHFQKLERLPLQFKPNCGMLKHCNILKLVSYGETDETRSKQRTSKKHVRFNIPATFNKPHHYKQKMDVSSNYLLFFLNKNYQRRIGFSSHFNSENALTNESKRIN